MADSTSCPSGPTSGPETRSAHDPPDCYAPEKDFPFHNAARNGDLMALRSLLESDSTELEVRSPFQATPLHAAILSGQTDAVRLLLAHGANTESLGPDEYCELCFTALHLAARDGKDQIVHLLLEAGADRKAKQKYSGRTALELAANAGHDGVVQILLEKEKNSDADSPSPYDVSEANLPLCLQLRTGIPRRYVCL